MSKNRLYRRFAHPAADHLGRQPVAEGMRRHVAFDPELPAKLRDDVLDRARADRRSRLADLIPTAKGRKPARAANIVLTILPVRGDRLRGLGIEVYGTALAALGPVDIRRPVDQIDIPPSQRAQLGDAHPRPERKRIIARTFRRRSSRCGFSSGCVDFTYSTIFSRSEIRTSGGGGVKRGINAAMRTRNRSVAKFGCRS